MSMYSPLRDAFKDLNNMILDRQQWNAEHEARARKFETDTMLLESQLKDQAQTRQLRQFQVNDEIDFRKPRDLNLGPIFQQDKHLITNPNFRKDIAMVLGDGVILNSDWSANNADGSVYQLSKKDQQFILPMLAGVRNKYNPAPEKTMMQLTALEEQIAPLEKKLSALSKSDSGRFIEETADLKVQIDTLKGKQTQLKKFFEPINMLSYYGKLKRQQEEFSGYAYAIGANQQGAEFLQSSKQYAALEKEILEKLYTKPKTRLEGREAKKVYNITDHDLKWKGRTIPPGKYAFMGLFDKESGGWIFGETVYDELPEGFGPDKPTKDGSGRDKTMTEKNEWDTLANQFGKFDDNGQFIVTPGLEQQHILAQSKRQELAYSEPDLSASERIIKADQWAKGLPNQLMNGIQTIMSDKTLSDADKQASLTATLEQFEKQYGYIPEEVMEALGLKD